MNTTLMIALALILSVEALVVVEYWRHRIWWSVVLTVGAQFTVAGFGFAAEVGAAVTAIATVAVGVFGCALVIAEAASRGVDLTRTGPVINTAPKPDRPLRLSREPNPTGQVERVELGETR